MNVIVEFVQNNIWLCLGIGVVVVIVADEVFGVTRNLLGDASERRRDAPAAPPPPPDPLVEREVDADEPAVEDFLTPPRKRH